MDNWFYIWLIIGSILMLSELIGTDFFLLFLGLSALVTSIVGVVGANWQVQVIVFCILSFCSIIFWFYRHSKHKANAQAYEPNMGPKNLVGRSSKVDVIEGDTAVKIIVNDTVYLATCKDMASLQVGDQVRIVDFDSAKDRLIIEKETK